MPTYELFPKVSYGKDFSVVNALGHVFELIYHRDKDYLRLFAVTDSQVEVLRKDFGVREDVEVPLPRFVGKVTFAKEKDFYWGAEFHDLTNFLTELREGEQFRLWVVLEPRLNDIFLKYSDKLKRNQSPIGRRQREVIASRLEGFAKDNVYYVQPYILADSKTRVKDLFDLLKRYITTNSGKLRLEIKEAEKWEDKTPRVPWYWFLRYKLWLWADGEKLDKVAVVPNPSVVPIQFSSGGLLPDIVPNRKGFRIGVLTFSGREVRLEVEDFFRHAYIIGGTGAGKTSTMRVLMKRIREAYPETTIVVIDPHGDYAEEMLSFFSNYHNNFDPERQLFYFHPVESPIPINPIALPKLPNAQQALLLGIANVMEIFEKLFALKEGAVYVKYIIQNALQLLYQKTPEPTFRDLYNIVIGLRNGTLDLPVYDKDWEEKLAMLQDLDDTTFISTLSRIEMLATNPLLVKLFSRNAIDDNVLFAPGNVVIVNASKGAVGEQVSFLIIAGWILKLWYYVLVRGLLDMKRTPIIVSIDEFQNVADLSVIDTILAEARKYGLHLILAHQHTGQVDMNLLKSLMSNTGVKFLMKMQGSDAEKFAEIFPEFREELLKTLPSQSVGQATLIITPRKPEDKVVPIRVNIDWEDFKKDKEAVKRVIERMKKYATAEPATENDVTALLNPVLKYVEERPDVLGKLILYETFTGTCEKGKHCIALVDLVRKLGVDRDRVEEAVAGLEAHGYLTVEKSKGKKILQYGKGLFPLKGVVENEKGKKVALRVIRKLYKEGFVVVAGRQEGDVRPDFVAFPYDRATLRPKYDEAVAVEVESDNEVMTHPEQVKRNMLKYANVNVFKEVRVYTSEDAFDRLRRIYDEFMKDETVGEEYKKKVKVFGVRVTEKATKGREEKAEVGGTTETEEKAETVATGRTVTVGGLKFEIIDDNDGRALIRLNGTTYRVDKKALDKLLGVKDVATEVKVEGKKIVYRIGRIEDSIALEPV